jgi:hypothetical protein
MTEDRFAKLEAMVKEIHDFIFAGDDSEKSTHRARFRRAVRELGKGNRKPLEVYLKQGGKIPRAEGA